MGLALSLIMLVSIFLAEVLGRDSPLSVGIASLGIAAFLFLLRIQNAGRETPLITEASMRCAIAGAVVIEYLALVATVAFFEKRPTGFNPSRKR